MNLILAVLYWEYTNILVDYVKADGSKPGFRIRIRTDPPVFALPGSGQKGKEMNE